MFYTIIKMIFTIIGWGLVAFFLIFVLVYYKYPIPLLCFLACIALACPLTKKLPFKLKLWLRIPLTFALFTFAVIHIPENDHSNIQNPDASINTTEESEPVSSTNNTLLPDTIPDDVNILPETKEEYDSLQKEPSLSEDEFKSQCIEYWHDDIFFSHSISKGNYVKLDLFVEEARFFDTVAAYAWPSSDLITDYDLQRDFFYCGVQRKDEYSYVGGQINLFFSNQYECSSSDISVGDHLIVYGEVIEFSTNTTDGYNYCSIIPRYIENNGQ